jgi:PAS domain S-box-containing protein
MAEKPTYEELKKRIQELEKAESEREKTTQALRESEEKFRDLFNNAEVGMFRTRLDGSEILDMNKRFLEIFGRTSEEVIGSPSVIFWADPFERQEMVRRLEAEGRVTDFECGMLHKRGETRRCLTSLRVCREQGILEGSIIDITERKRSEELLVQAKQEWEQTFNAIPDLIAILGNNHQIIRANKAMADKLGVTTERAVGLTCYEHVHGTREPPIHCPHSMLLADGREHIVEVHEKRLGGDFLVTVSPLHDTKGHLVGSVHLARDITERKRTEEERKELIEGLQKTIEKVKMLSGLLPICSGCKRIRDDKGYWNQIELYIRKHSEAEFSHGLCPECAKRLYPDLDISHD